MTTSDSPFYFELRTRTRLDCDPSHMGRVLQQDGETDLERSWGRCPRDLCPSSPHQLDRWAHKHQDSLDDNLMGWSGEH